jgi:hypothetical protein
MVRVAEEKGTYVFKPNRLLVVCTSKSIDGYLDGLLLRDVGGGRGDAVRLDEAGAESNNVVVLVEGSVRDGVGEPDTVVLLAHVGDRTSLSVRSRSELDGVGRDAGLLLNEGDGRFLHGRASTLGERSTSDTEGLKEWSAHNPDEL